MFRLHGKIKMHGPERGSLLCSLPLDRLSLKSVFKINLLRRHIAFLFTISERESPTRSSKHYFFQQTNSPEATGSHAKLFPQTAANSTRKLLLHIADDAAEL